MTTASPGVVVWVEEWFHLADLGDSPDNYPIKPTHLDVSASPAGQFSYGADFQPGVSTVRFQTSSRYFEGIAAFGTAAPASAVDDVNAILDSFSADPVGG